jgi:hypothetical protein
METRVATNTAVPDSSEEVRDLGELVAGGAFLDHLRTDSPVVWEDRLTAARHIIEDLEKNYNPIGIDGVIVALMVLRGRA